MITAVSIVAGILGILISTVSVLFLARQTRAVARQTEIANAIAGTTVLKGATDGLREVFRTFLDRPNLRAYFYEGRKCPTRGRDRVRVLTLAEALGDVLEVGLLATRLIPSAESTDDFRNYCRDILAGSPTLVDMTRAYPDWWPELHEISVEVRRNRFPLSSTEH